MWYETFAEYIANEYKDQVCATDALIEYQGGLVFIERKHAPHGIGIPGGILEKITAEDNVVKEVKEETGLDFFIDKNYINRPIVTSDPHQDPRARIVSLAYAGKGYGVLKPDPKEDATRAFVVPYEKLPDLLKQDNWAFAHHKKIIRTYLEAK